MQMPKKKDMHIKLIKNKLSLGPNGGQPLGLFLAIIR